MEDIKTTLSQLSALAEKPAVSDARVLANRQNAKLSTGPKTTEGKQRSSKNATTHGLCAEEAVASFEDADEFTTLHKAMHSRYLPAGPMEAALVDRITSCVWRLRRVGYLESAMMSANAQRGVQGAFLPSGQYLNLSRYEAAIERSMYRAIAELERLLEERRPVNVMLQRIADELAGG